MKNKAEYTSQVISRQKSKRVRRTDRPNDRQTYKVDNYRNFVAIENEAFIATAKERHGRYLHICLRTMHPNLERNRLAVHPFFALVSGEEKLKEEDFFAQNHSIWDLGDSTSMQRLRECKTFFVGVSVISLFFLLFISLIQVDKDNSLYSVDPPLAY